jgi:membrane-bound ClpP family serine protease
MRPKQVAWLMMAGLLCGQGALGVLGIVALVAGKSLPAGDGYGIGSAPPMQQTAFLAE